MAHLWTSTKVPTDETRENAMREYEQPSAEQVSKSSPSTEQVSKQQDSKSSSSAEQGSKSSSSTEQVSKPSPSPEKHAQDNRLPEAYFNESLLQSSDNTGTRKFKNLLRGLKVIMNQEYSPSENPDLMPDQLARFYEDLNGNYNELFLNTPRPSIAFIYKSLGCSYSLQPSPHAEKVAEPDIPGLKTEGWIVWSTIQMLLGPDEHAGFLMDAVKKWDVIDPDTGKIFPKTLPRGSLPAKADSRMVEWYEGVSDRLKKEAEEEAAEKEQQRAIEQQTEHRRIAIRRDDEEDSVDSRGPALAYFRNPLYRHHDGQPSIVRKSNRRPALSPRISIADKGKEAATAVGQVIRNVANPHLWDGNGSKSSSRERRRRSVPDSRHHHHPSEPAPPGVPHDDRLSLSGPQHRRRTSDRKSSDADDSHGSEEPTSAHGSHTSQHLRPRKNESQDQTLRHSRSHEPTPSQKDYDDYFPQQEPSLKHRRSSAYGDDGPTSSPVIGPSFKPSSDLPLAVQVGRQRQSEQDRPPRRGPSERDDRPYSPMDPRGRGNDAGSNAPPRKSHSQHDDRSRHNGRPPPPPDQHRRSERPQHGRQNDGRDNFDDSRRSHDDSRNSHNDSRRSHDDSRRNHNDSHNDSRRSHDDSRKSHNDGHNDSRRSHDESRSNHNDSRRDYDSPESRRADRRRSASNRRSGGSDMDSGYSGPDDRDRRQDRKQARFAPTPVSGVDGRKYVDQAPWKT